MYFCELDRLTLATVVHCWLKQGHPLALLVAYLSKLAHRFKTLVVILHLLREVQLALTQWLGAFWYQPALAARAVTFALAVGKVRLGLAVDFLLSQEAAVKVAMVEISACVLAKLVKPVLVAVLHFRLAQARPPVDL
jgi:hypothetical protein